MPNPKAAVIVPTKNRPGQLAVCLEAMAEQDHPDFHVVVIDNGGKVDLEPVAAPHRDWVTLLSEMKPGPAAARNAGVRVAEAEMIAFTDDDCRPEPQWLSTLDAALSRDRDALIGGETINRLQDSICSQTSQTLVSFLYSYYGATAGTMPYFASNNLACSRDVFLDLGGFDETFPNAAAEDRDLGMRWGESGRALVFAPEARVHHAHHLTLLNFCRQHRNYGRGARHLHQLMARRGAEALPFEGFGFYGKLLTYPMRQRQRHALRQSALLFLSQLATAYGYYTLAFRNRAWRDTKRVDLP
ncbi:MAG: glycosyltransferase [Paracoccaceae bacterium]